MWFNSPGVASTVFTDADGIEPYPVGFGAVEGSVDSGAVGSGTVGRPVGSGAVVGSKGFDRGRSGGAANLAWTCADGYVSAAVEFPSTFDVAS